MDDGRCKHHNWRGYCLRCDADYERNRYWTKEPPRQNGWFWAQVHGLKPRPVQCYTDCYKWVWDGGDPEDITIEYIKYDNSGMSIRWCLEPIMCPPLPEGDTWL